MLLLKKRGLVQSGLSEDYINISFEAPLDRPSGSLVSAKVDSWNGGGLESQSGFLMGALQ